jgi:hypothetical protein
VRAAKIEQAPLIRAIEAAIITKKNLAFASYLLGECGLFHKFRRGVRYEVSH